MKKVISLLFAVMMVLSLSACGGNETATDNDIGSSTIQNQTDETDTSSTEQNIDTHSSTTNNIGGLDSTDVPSSTTSTPTTTTTTKPETSKSSTTTKPETSTPSTTTKPTTPTHTHSYSSATCTEPAKCSCGETSGSALGHSYSNATCTEAEKCTRCGTTSGSALGHSYKDATCTEPKTCTKCGSTNGNALGHKEVIDNAVSATCTKSGLSEGKHCSICNTVIVAQEIIPATHQYTDATCTEPQKCKLCGSTYGTHNGHDFSQSNSCSSCGMWLSDIFDYEYYGGSYFVGDRNYTYGTAYITNCSKTYYKYNNSLTLVVSTKATISAVYPGTSGSVTYSVCLYKDGVLFDSKSCYVSGKKGATGTDSVTFYNITPGTYEIKIRN